MCENRQINCQSAERKKTYTEKYCRCVGDSKQNCVQVGMWSGMPGSVPVASVDMKQMMEGRLHPIGRTAVTLTKYVFMCVLPVATYWLVQEVPLSSVVGEN